MTKGLLLALGSSALACGAQAQARPSGAPTCPDGASQQMYAYVVSLQAGEQVDLNELNSLMQTVINQCATDRDPLNIVVYLSGAFATQTNDASHAKHWLDTGIKAYELATELEKLGYHKPTDYKGADGESAAFYPYNYATQAYNDKLMPIMVQLKPLGYEHAWISDRKLDTCLYGDRTENRLQAETKAWLSMAVEHWKEAYSPAKNRLIALREACPDYRALLDYHLGATYAAEADGYALKGKLEYWDKTQLNPVLIAEAKKRAAQAIPYLEAAAATTDVDQLPVNVYSIAFRVERMQEIINADVPDAAPG